jgi:hypothetical protein
MATIANVKGGIHQQLKTVSCLFLDMGYVLLHHPLVSAFFCTHVLMTVEVCYNPLKVVYAVHQTLDICIDSITVN